MAFISELIGRPITDVDGRRIGTLSDLVARPLAGVRAPRGYSNHGSHQVRRSGQSPLRSWQYYSPPRFRFVERSINPPPTYSRMLTFGWRNMCWTSRSSTLTVPASFASMTSSCCGSTATWWSQMWMSASWAFFVGSDWRIWARGWRAGSTGNCPGGVISWDFVELLLHDEPMRLRVPSRKLAELHPSDIAEIISDLNRAEHAGILQQLELSQLADTLEEVEPDFQANLLEHFPDEKVADVLEEMAPDEATDLLAEMPQERRQGLLRLMESKEAAEVRELLKYDEDSAGGLMTTEYLAVSSSMTAGQAIEYLRRAGEEAELLYYVYVTNADGEP